jgi:hypothetical protein
MGTGSAIGNTLRGARATAFRRAAVPAAIAAGAVTGAIVGASLVNGGSTTPDPFKNNYVQFPNDLIQNDHWIEFSAESTKQNLQSAVGDLLSSLTGVTVAGGTIRLPMPSNLSTDYHPLYTSSDLDMAAGAILKPFDRGLYGNDDIGAKAAMSAAAVGTVMTAAGGAAKAAGAAAGFNIALDGNTTAAALKVFGGMAQNPHKIVLFTGVDFRDHNFSWKLSPRNRNESNAIRQIIEMFKFYSHPEYIGGGLFFKYPEFFRIKFRHPSYLFEMEPSVCTGIRVNYHSSGFASYIRDGDGSGVPAPAEVSLELTFKETEVITKQTLTRESRNQSQQITPAKPPTPAPMPATDALGNPLGNGTDVNGNQIR